MTGKIFMLEGADCSGKTNLAKAIMWTAMEDGLDAVYLHGSPWPGTVFREHMRMLMMAGGSYMTGAIVVLDHFWIAEQLYGREYRGVAAYLPKTIDECMQEMDAKIVLCVRSDPEAQARAHAERRAAGKEHFADAYGIIGRYRALLDSPPPWSPDGPQITKRGDVICYDMDTWKGKSLDFANMLLQAAVKS